MHFEELTKTLHHENGHIICHIHNAYYNIWITNNSLQAMSSIKTNFSTDEGGGIVEIELDDSSYFIYLKKIPTGFSNSSAQET